MKLAIFSALLSLGLGSCAAFGYGEPEEKWVEEKIEGVIFENLWETSKQAMTHARFVLKDQDAVKGMLVSSWRFDLNPYSREEKRYRANIRLLRRDDGSVLLGARVEKEGNAKMEATMNPEQGEWEPQEDDEEQARFLLQYVILKSKDFGPSEEFYRKQRWKKPGE